MLAQSLSPPQVITVMLLQLCTPCLFFFSGGVSGMQCITMLGCEAVAELTCSTAVSGGGLTSGMSKFNPIQAVL